MKYIIKTTYHLDDISSILKKCNDNDEIVISKGTYYSYPLDITKSIKITIEKDANIYFSTDIEDYLDSRFIRFEGVECLGFHPLIYSNGVDNITICGEGKIFGNGYAWWKNKKLQAESCNRLCYSEAKHIKLEDRIVNLKESCLRPDFIEFVNCNHITLKNFTIQDSPMWMIHPVYCKDITIDDIKLISDGPNTDGIDPDSCEDVIISNCNFSTGDDGIAINSGLNEDGRRVNKPCKNVEIKNCTFNKGHASIAIGSAMSGGVEDIYIHDITINNSERGIRVKSLPGRGGYVKDIKVENIKMSVEKEGIELTMDYPSSTSIPFSKVPPIFSSFIFKNIEIDKAKTGVSLLGLDNSKIEDVKLKNISYKDVEKKIESVYAEYSEE